MREPKGFRLEASEEIAVMLCAKTVEYGYLSQSHPLNLDRENVLDYLLRPGNGVDMAINGDFSEHAFDRQRVRGNNCPIMVSARSHADFCGVTLPELLD